MTDSGTLFRVDSTGTVMPLHSLPPFAPGELIQGADGRLYGTTECCNGGTIFTVDLQAATLATLHQFTAGENDGSPNGVIQTRDGQFYGTTAGGGAAAAPPLFSSGTVFSMDAAGARTTLHTFYFCPLCNPFRADGTPGSNLFEGADGSLYGTMYTAADTVTPPGQIFRISPAGDFTRVSSNYFLQAGVIQARDGRLYGTASGGQINTFFRSYGSVFRLEANGTGTVLHQFDGTESAFPVAELVEIDDGSLYGTTQGGFFFFPDPPGPIPGAISGVTLPPGRSRFAIASTDLTATGQPAG